MEGVDKDIDHLREVTKIQLDEFEKRLDNMTSDSEKLKDLQRIYLPREVYDINHRDLINKVDKLIEWKNNLQGRLIVAVSILGAVWTLVVALLIYSLNKKF